MKHLRLVILLALAVFAAQALAAPTLPQLPNMPKLSAYAKASSYATATADRPAPAIQKQSKRDTHKRPIHADKRQRPAQPQRPVLSAKAASAITVPAVKGVVAPEFKINTDSMPSDLYRDYPAAAMQEDGTIISVWTDSRNGSQNVFFQRFTQLGMPIGGSVAVDPRPIDSYEYSPSIAVGLNGTFAITWSDYRGTSYYNIYCRLFDASGNPLDTAFRVDDYYDAGHEYSSITATDSGFAVVWYDYRNGDSDIYLQLLDTLGGLKGANVMVNGITTDYQYYPNAARIGQGFVVTWWDQRSGGQEIYARRYNANGDAIGTEFVVNDNSGYSRYEPKACGTDSGFTITWYDYGNGFNYQIYVQRYDTAGAAVGANYRVTDGTTDSYSPTIAHRNGQTVVSWYDYRNGTNYDVFAQWFKPNGDTLGGQVLLSDDITVYFQYSPKAVAGDSGWAFIWMDERNSGVRLAYGQNYDTTLAVIGVNYMACDSVYGMQDQYDPSVAAGKNGNFLTVWYDYRFDDGSGNICDIFGRLYDQDGNALTQDFLISDTAYSPDYRYAYEPKVAGLADGSYMVAWYDYRSDNDYDIYGQRVSAAGSLVDANYLISIDNPDAEDYELYITAADSGYGVFWYGYKYSNSDIFGRLYRTNGDSIGTTIALTDTTIYNDAYYPSLDANDSGLVVVWEDYRDDNYYHIYGQRVLWDGSLYGGNFLIGDSLDVHQWEPSVAGTNQGFMVTWYDSRDGNDAVYGQYLDVLGQKVGANFAISTDPSLYHYEPSVAVSPDGNRYAVFWYTYIGSHDVLLSQRYQNGLAQGGNETVVDTTTWNWMYVWGAQNIAATEDRLFFTWYGQNGYTGSDVFGKVTDWYAIALPPVVWVDSLPDDIDSAYGPYTVNAVITDDGGVDQAVLYYQIKGGSWDTLSMTAGTSDSFSAVIPEQFLSLYDTVNISYYVWALDDAKNFISSPARTFLLTNSPTGVAGGPDGAVPSVYALGNAYPNPSRGQTAFKYQLPRASQVSLKIYNIVGQEVKRFDLGAKPAGYHQVSWNDRNVSAGVYFYRLQAGDFSSTKKLMIVR